jgi:hypothetical protein
MAWEGSTRKQTLPRDWPRLRKVVLERCGYRCEWAEDGYRCHNKATDVDHKADRLDDSAASPEELEQVEPTAENAFKYFPPSFLDPTWQNEESGKWLLPELRQPGANSTTEALRWGYGPTNRPCLTTDRFALTHLVENRGLESRLPY